MSTATNENKLRHHAEQQFAEELGELKKSDARQRPANWELSPWAVCTYLLGGELDNGFTVSAKYIGNRRHHRNGGRYAGDGSGAPAVRGSGNGEIVGVRTLGGGHQRRLHAHHPGHGGHQRRTDAVWLELCGTALQRAVPRRAGGKPAHARHVRRPHRPRGGTDPHPRRRAGYADHHPVRKDPPHPRAQRRSAGRARLQPHRHGEQPG